MSTPPDASTFRRTLATFATGVTVVTTVVEDPAARVIHGMTANAFTSVSLDPLLVLVCVDRVTGMHELLARSSVFAATVLAAEQADLSVWFSSPRRLNGTDEFARVGWRPAPITGCPVILGGISFVDCKLTEVHEGGDHSIFLGEVVDLGTMDADADPLIFFGGGYHRLRR